MLIISYQKVLPRAPCFNVFQYFKKSFLYQFLFKYYKLSYKLVIIIIFKIFCTSNNPIEQKTNFFVSMHLVNIFWNKFGLVHMTFCSFFESYKIYT